ncbi:K(+)-transporting ATPase subunit C [Clostridium sp. P21]|uniref:Potassium-transporting ATPase KdpC subunit n=1 Tax=Clostridium muellerianum TaxID=2716538 RepID=A0A7Y0ELR5_9CLOT|nr:K(+)-transporting ATPase subunit C [Clostridium muellerianum]NMM65780.1 K(+)-transporting ATPase subunit C [Clostridium muellerianum]
MKMLKRSVILTVVLMVLCGIIYPLAMTGISQIVFNKKANGSMIVVNGKEVGSELIGQNFTDTRFFRGRVSSVNYNTYTEADTKPDKNGKINYSGVGSGAQNLAPSNKALEDRVKKDIEDFLKANPKVKKEDIPVDLITSSGSGLDPDISEQSARIQIDSISKATNIPSSDLEKIIVKYTKGRSLGLFGEPRVNVLLANLEISNILKHNGKLQ